MKVVNRYKYEGVFSQRTSGVTTTTYGHMNGRSQLFPNGDQSSSVDHVLIGDRKTPNPFSFVSKKQGGVHYSMDKTYARGYGQSWVFDYARGENDGLYEDDVWTVDYAITENEAMSKIYDQLRGSTNLVVDFAESKQTLKMLKGTKELSQTWSDFVNTIKKTRKYKALSHGQQALDLLTRKWLEYRYGWLPLTYSIYGAMDNLLKTVVERDVRVRARSSRTIENPFTVHTTDIYGRPVYRTNTVSYRTMYGMVFRLPDGLQLYDWTSLNPVGIAWELTPLSFVADWVLNVGQVLSLMENYWIYNSHFVKGFKTNSSFQNPHKIVTASYNKPHPWAVDGNGEYLTQLVSSRERFVYGPSEYRTMTRTVFTTLPFVANLRLEVKLGSVRQLDAAALFHQIVASKLR